ncbi:MAG: hypothetical protein MUO70_03930 [Euryarchaeota archaeon]|nr:hypothetical protein [Euryarchaeota archaeon]
MAMEYREPNRARWVGVRPGHDGEQVQGMHGATNAIWVLYTVPDGKILCVTYVELTSVAAGAGLAYLNIRDPVPADFYYFAVHNYAAVGCLTNAVGLSFPYEVPAGYTIQVGSTAVNVVAHGSFHGFIISV